MILSAIKGFVIVNSFWRGGDEGAKNIAEALKAHGINVQMVCTDEVRAMVQNRGNSAAPCDFAVFLDKDMHVSAIMEALGVRLFNGAEAIRIADDKMLTHIALAKHGVCQPATISAPLCFCGEAKESFFNRVEQTLGYPIVVKKCHGSFGNEVWLARTREQLLRLGTTLLKEPHIYQQYIDCGGCDTRVIVIGGKAVAAMKRQAREGEFRSNIGQGGTGTACTAQPEVLSLAEKCAKVLCLDYCGVDIVTDGKNHYVLEVNSNAHYKEIQRVSGVDVAGLYAEHIARTVCKCSLP